MTILSTGFGPYDGGTNASEALVRALGSNAPAGAETCVLPVDTNGGDLLAEAVERFRPRLVLLTGQAAGRNRIGLERLAVNRRDFRVPDGAGVVLNNVPVLERGPERLISNWPISREISPP